MSSFLFSQEARDQLVDRINKRVDIPMMGEGLEGTVIKNAVDACLDAMQGMMAPSTVGKDSDELVDDDAAEAGEDPKASMKDNIIATINEKVNIFGLNEDQEAALIRGVVDQIFQMYPGAKTIE